MLNRRNLVLVGTLILQMILVAVVLWPRSTESSGEGQSLFPGVEAAQVVALSISDATGETIDLASSAGSWVLPDADNYPCQEGKVPDLLAKLVALRGDSLVTQTGDSHKRLKVAEDDFVRRIEFELADGTRYQLYVGSSPTFSATHIRVEGQNQVYLTSELSSSDAGTQATAWVDRTYFSVTRGDIVELTLENDNGQLGFVKVGEDWSLKDLALDEAFSDSSFQSLLSRASSISMLRPLGREDQESYGLQRPTAVVTIRTHSDDGGDKTYTLSIGAQDAQDSSYVIKSSESPYYVRVSEFTVQEFVDKARDDYLELPPTPTPTPAEEATPTPEG